MIKSPLIRPLIQQFKNVVHGLGIDVVLYDVYHSENKLLERMIREFGVQTILDVGANVGQYGQEVIRHGFRGDIHSFEAIPSVYQKLAKRSERYANWKAYNFGVGASEQSLMINISENLVSSSFLKVGQASVDAEAKTKTTHQEKINVVPLDNFFESTELKKEILLKLDVQGYEMEALKGVVKSLHLIKIVQAELSFTEIYEGAPLYDEVINFLKGHGYEIFSIIPGFRDERTGRMLQADGIFVRY